MRATRCHSASLRGWRSTSTALTCPMRCSHRHVNDPIAALLERLGAEGDMQWIVRGERLVDDTPHVRISLVDVEILGHAKFTQYVFRMRRWL